MRPISSQYSSHYPAKSSSLPLQRAFRLKDPGGVPVDAAGEKDILRVGFSDSHWICHWKLVILPVSLEVVACDLTHFAWEVAAVARRACALDRRNTHQLGHRRPHLQFQRRKHSFTSDYDSLLGLQRGHLPRPIPGDKGRQPLERSSEAVEAVLDLFKGPRLSNAQP